MARVSGSSKGERGAMKWEKHPTSRNPERYHLNCKIVDGKHVFDVSVIVRKDGYEVYMPERTAGGEFLHKFDSLEKLNRFLKELGYPPLEIK